jgi:hypothetical protein
VVNERLGGFFKKLTGRSRPDPAAAATHVDEDGFAHFKPAAAPGDEKASEPSQAPRHDVRGILRRAGSAARVLLNDLGEAAQKDWGTYREDD